MSVFQYDSFHRLLERYSQELPSILSQHYLTEKLVPRVEQGLAQNETPFTVAVVGQMRVGKSSLLNTLVGADLAVTGVNETTATINWFKYAEGEHCDRFRVVWKDKPEEEFPRSEIDHWIGNSELAQKALRLEFFADVEFLKNAYIVDTPGTRAVIDAHEEIVQNFIADKQDVDKLDADTKQQGDRADAIIYVFPPVARETDEDLLLSFKQGSRIQNAAPYNSVAVVHKWETINSPDPYREALQKAESIGRRFKDQVAEVLPVSAPMGWACEHFGDEFWQTAFDLGRQAVDVLKNLLRTDQFFIRDIPGCTLSAEKRKIFRNAHKLPWPTLKFIINRVGIDMVETPEQLKARIDEISGINKLREMLDKRFFSRSKMIRKFGVLGKTLPICDEASKLLRNHKIRFVKLADDARLAAKELSGINLSGIVHDYINKTQALVQGDLHTAEKTLKTLDELVLQVKDVFEEMNSDTKYLDQLDLLDKYDWGADWKPKLARLFGQSGPELPARLSGIVPEVNSGDLDTIVEQLETAFSELSNRRFQASGEAKKLIQHAHERLGHLLEEIEES